MSCSVRCRQNIPVILCPPVNALSSKILCLFFFFLWRCLEKCLNHVMVSPLANIHPAVFVSLDCQTFQPRICLTVLSTVLLRAQLEHKVSYTTNPWIKFYGLYCHTVNMYLYMYKMSWLTSCLGKDNQRHATHTQHYAIHPLFTKISVAKLFSSTITLPISTHTHTRLPSLFMGWIHAAATSTADFLQSIFVLEMSVYTRLIPPSNFCHSSSVDSANSALIKLTSRLPGR